MRKVIVSVLTVGALAVCGGAPAMSAAPAGSSPPIRVRAQGLTSDQVAALDAGLVESWGGLPGGATAGLWVPGKGSWVGSVGKADLRTGAPMRPVLQLPVGSVTKTLTGTIVLQEVERGHLRLAQRLSRWFPKYPKARQITVAMLLNMSSGIADFVNGNFKRLVQQQRRDPKRQWTPGQMIWGAAKMPRAFPVPGSQFAYSNTNTILLGRILEKVTGRSYDALLHRRILGPLGMDRSFLDISGTLWKPHAQTYSMLYGQVVGSPRLIRTTNWSLSTGWSAGGLASTQADMHRWAKALGTGKGVLKRATQRLRTRHCVVSATADQYTQEYCLGLAVFRERSTGEIVAYLHNGTMLGASSYVAYYPRTRAALVVQANQDAETGAGGQTIPDSMSFAVFRSVPELLGLG